MLNGEVIMKTTISTRTRYTTKTVAIATLVTGSMIFGTSSQAAPQAAVGLGTASTYAVLAGSTVTNTGPTTFSGSAGSDLGLSPGSSITNEVQITKTGSTHISDPQAVKAQEDLVTAYNDAAGRALTGTISADLGGQTLVTGTYNSASSLGLTGTLTLDAQGDPSAVWVFQAGSTLTTASSSSVSLINGAQACNVFWQIGSSAVLGTDSTLVGHVMAMESITANTRATIQGSLLARNAAVTLDTNTIINAPCAAVATASATPTESATATPASTATSTPAATVTPAPKTKKGGKLPDTGTSFALVVAAGIALVAGGAALLRARRRRD